jgi:Mce-associated membrane protein
MKLLKAVRSDAASVELNQGDSADAAVADDVVIAELVDDVDNDQRAPMPLQRRRIGWRPVVTYGVLPALAVLLVVGFGYLKWQNSAAARDHVAATDSVLAATEGTVAMLSYRPDTVAKDLDAARGRLTGQFLDSYTSLTDDVVIPGAQQKQIAATATVPAAASASATGTHAVVLLFVNQTTTVGPGTPTSTASSVRVTLDRVNGRWLISQFDPV